MKEHCIIDGKRCSKCCEVVTISMNKNSRERSKYIQYGGTYLDGSDDQVWIMLKPISKRRAKLMNPSLVNTVGNSQSYFTCKHHKDNLCTNYENRPPMCSKYPLYGKTKEGWGKWVRDTDNLIGLYRGDCTYYDKNFYKGV